MNEMNTHLTSGKKIILWFQGVASTLDTNNTEFAKEMAICLL